MSKADREGLSWDTASATGSSGSGMHLYGPAQLGDAEDPHRRLERQRAARVAAARLARETGQ